MYAFALPVLVEQSSPQHARLDLSLPYALQTVLEVQRGAEAIAENYKHSCFESKKQYDAMYKQSTEDPESFWSNIAKEFYWKKQVHLHLYALCYRLKPACVNQAVLAAT